jgi:uncharacterized protein DUF732
MRTSNRRPTARLCLGAALFGTTTALLVAAPAHADNDGFIADLAAHGVPFWGSPMQMTAMGYRVCGQIRNGEAPDTAATQFNWLNAVGPAIVAAAQDNLCPDTLH